MNHGPTLLSPVSIFLSLHSPSFSSIPLIPLIPMRSVLLYSFKMMAHVLSSAFKRKQTVIASTHLETCSFTSNEFFFFSDESHKLCAQTQTFNLEGEEFLADNSTGHEPNREGVQQKDQLEFRVPVPLLNGKVASWSLHELCWKGAQGQLC